MLVVSVCIFPVSSVYKQKLLFSDNKNCEKCKLDSCSNQPTNIIVSNRSFWERIDWWFVFVQSTTEVAISSAVQLHKDDSFWHSYWNSVDNIVNDPRSVASYRLKLIWLFVWIKNCHFVYVFLNRRASQQSELVRLVTADHHRFFNASSLVNLEMALQVALLPYLFNAFYRKMSGNKLCSLFKEIVMENNRKWVFQTKIDIQARTLKTLNFYQPFCWVYSEYSVFFWKTSTISFVFHTDFALIYVVSYFYIHIWKYLTDLSTALLFMTTIFVLVFVLYVVTMLQSFIISLWSALFVFATSTCFIRFQYCEQLVNSSRKFNLKTAMLNFINIHHETLQFVFSLNKLLGNSLLYFIMANIPFNTTVLMDVFLGQYGTVICIIFGSFAIVQLTMIVFIHLLGAFYAKRIHRPIKGLMSLYVRTNHFPNQRLRLRVSLYIQSLWTKKTYGISYGTYGFITLFAFAKVRILILVIHTDFVC